MRYGLDMTMTLREVLQQHRDRTGDSYRDIAGKTGLSTAKIGQLMAEQLPYAPTTTTMTKLSEGLGIPLSVLYAARATSLGVSDDGTAERSQLSTLIMSHVDEMNPRSLRTLEAIAAAILQVQRAEDEARGD